MKGFAISIGKPEQGSINEDAVKVQILPTPEKGGAGGGAFFAERGVIAVSDGAGGGGLFADRWSSYLLRHLPESPIFSADDLDAWIAIIWEPFYNHYEEEAKKLGGMSLDKFYDEGSFATLVAVWMSADGDCQWMSFGDSVAFHYNFKTKQLEHSFSALSDFNRPPYLINCKDELIKKGFRNGKFEVDASSVVFVTSDALAHYIIMMYEVGAGERYSEDLDLAESNYSRNSNYIKAARTIRKVDFEQDVINKLILTVNHRTNFERHIKKLIRNGLIALDDYSIAMLL